MFSWYFIKAPPLNCYAQKDKHKILNNYGPNVYITHEAEEVFLSMTGHEDGIIETYEMLLFW